MECDVQSETGPAASITYGLVNLSENRVVLLFSTETADKAGEVAYTSRPPSE